MGIQENSINTITNIFNKKQTKKQWKFLVVGAGKFGEVISSELVNLGQHVTVIDRDQKKIDAIGQKVDNALVVNSLSEKEIGDHVPTNIDHCIVAVGSNVSDSFIVVFNLLKFLNIDINKITVKVFDDRQQSILQSMGIVNFIRAEKAAARNHALKLVYPAVSNIIDIAENVACYQVKIRNSEIDGKTVQSLDDQFKSMKIGFIVSNGEIMLAEKSTILKRMQTLIIVSDDKTIAPLSALLTKVNKEV